MFIWIFYSFATQPFKTDLQVPLFYFMKKISALLITILLIATSVVAEDGYRLWLRYDKIEDASLLAAYKKALQGWMAPGNSATLEATRRELSMGLEGLLGSALPEWKTVKEGAIVFGTPANSGIIAALGLGEPLGKAGKEGYLIQNATYNGKRVVAIAANTDQGVMYGVFHFLRLLQTHQSVNDLSIASTPAIGLRLLNHWDNLDRTVERGYAGFSIWDWHRLPLYIDPRYIDYARANASIGINGTVLTNVNANALILRPDYLEKVKALADVFRPYGIKVYLTARFSAPIELGGLSTADPLDPMVKQWWKDKIDEIYKYVPDFGGLLVKANSEGQPGPQNYGRSHADGANILADALEPYGGVVIWRAFVYSNEQPEDRAKQANMEFEPLDGSFHKNVLIQVKNGPIDFQPREPFHPLFGAMPKTPLMMEFQITQEYLGQGTNLVFLAPMWEEVLQADTHVKGAGSTVARIIEGQLDGHSLTGMAGVSNIGNDRCWTGHPIAQANWYAFGRLAWNPMLSSVTIAAEWIRMTYSNNDSVVRPLTAMLLQSHEICVDYMTPLGLHHIMGAGHHYGPGPWVNQMSRADWTSVYYHKADSLGIGFDRTATGSNAVSQYAPQVRDIFASRTACPEKLLLWFHHVGWQETLEDGKTLWESLCLHYDQGVAGVKKMHEIWRSLEKYVDAERFHHVDMLLSIQEQEAAWWRNACIAYFQSISKLPLPKGVAAPPQTLEYYEGLTFPYAPGIRPRW